MADATLAIASSAVHEWIRLAISEVKKDLIAQRKQLKTVLLRKIEALATKTIELIKVATDFMAEQLKDFIDGITKLLDTIKDWMKKVIADPVDVIIDIWTKVKKYIKELISGIYDWVKDAIATAVDFWMEKGEKLYNWIKDMITNAIDFWMKKGEKMYNWVKDLVKGLIDDMMESTGKIFKKIKDIVSKVLKKVWDAIKDLGDKIGETIDKIKQELQDALDELEEFLKFPEKFFAKIAEVTESRWDNVSDNFINILSKILASATVKIGLSTGAATSTPVSVQTAPVEEPTISQEPDKPVELTSSQEAARDVLKQEEISRAARSRGTSGSGYYV